jgi:hydrogenase assembly chaperone HypC/HupF
MAPGRVVSVDGQECEVRTGSRTDRVSMMLEPDLRVGDWVLVNTGTVVRRLDEDQAAEMTRAVGILFGAADDDPAAGGGAGSTDAAGPARAEPAGTRVARAS